MSSSRVIVLGSINTDLVIRGKRLPSPGETVLGGRFYQAGGGKGANQAVAAARLASQPVSFVAAVGDDAFGRQAIQRFAHENLDCQHVKTLAGEASGVALILVDEQGENLISVASGANACLTRADVDSLPDDVFPPGCVFLTCLETPLEAVTAGLTRAKAAGLRTIFNPAPADPAVCQNGLLQKVDVLTPNAGEAAALSGLDTSDDDGAVAAAERLREMGCASCIITLGSRGCVVVQREVTWIAGRSVQAVDATAAGDAFNGALAVAMAEGRSLVEAAEWANRVAAITVTRAGAQPSLPHRAELE